MHCVDVVMVHYKYMLTMMMSELVNCVCVVYWVLLF